MAKYDELIGYIKVSDEMNSRVLKNIESHFEKEASKSAHMTNNAEIPAARRKASNKSIPKWVSGLSMMVAIMVLCIYPLMKMINPIELGVIGDQGQSEGDCDNDEEKDNNVNMDQITSEDYENTENRPGYHERADEDHDAANQIPPEGESNSYEVESIDELSEAVGFTVPVVGGIPFEVIDVRYFGDDESVSIIYFGEADKRLYFSMSRSKELYSGGYLRTNYRKTVKVLSLDVILEGFIYEGFVAVSWADEDFGYSLQITGRIDEASLVRMAECVIRNQQK